MIDSQHKTNSMNCRLTFELGYIKSLWICRYADDKKKGKPQNKCFENLKKI